jgi:hypothetical protein
MRRFEGERFAMAVAVVACVTGFSVPAQAWSKACKWPTPGGGQIVHIPVRVHCQSFEQYGYPCSSVRDAVWLASRPWNVTTSSEVRLQYPSVTSSWAAEPGEIRIRMHPQHSTPTVLASTGYCAGNQPTINVHASHHWSLTLPTPEGAWDMVTILTHELGHALGMNHSSANPGACGGVKLPCDPLNGIPCERAMMTAGAGVDTRSRTLWWDDIIGFSYGGDPNCDYAIAKQGGDMLLRASTDAGETWSTIETIGASVGYTMTPGMAADGFGNLVLGLVNPGNQTQIWRYTGSLSAVASMGWALAAPTFAYGNGMFVGALPLFFQGPSLPSDRTGELRVFRSTDGGASWFWIQYPAMPTAHRPAIAWNENSQRWYLAIVEHPGTLANNNPSFVPGRLAIYWSTNAILWEGPLRTGDRASAGPGLTCPPDTGGRCWLVYPDARVAQGTLRERVFRPCEEDDMGPIDLEHWNPCRWTGHCNLVGLGGLAACKFSQNFLFPDADGIRVASHDDVSAFYDPSQGAVVFALRSRTLGLGVVTWLDHEDTAPPPGFSGQPPAPLFDSVGLPVGFATQGVAVTSNPFFGGTLVWALGLAGSL